MHAYEWNEKPFACMRWWWWRWSLKAISIWISTSHQQLYVLNAYIPIHIGSRVLPRKRSNRIGDKLLTHSFPIYICSKEYWTHLYWAVVSISPKTHDQKGYYIGINCLGFRCMCKQLVYMRKMFSLALRFPNDCDLSYHNQEAKEVRIRMRNM